MLSSFPIGESTVIEIPRNRSSTGPAMGLLEYLTMRVLGAAFPAECWEWPHATKTKLSAAPAKWVLFMESSWLVQQGKCAVPQARNSSDDRALE
jgi:hypothetical protein